MNKRKIASLVLAVVFLAVALAARAVPAAVSWMLLPILTVISVAMSVLEIVDYKKSKDDPARGARLIPMIGLVVLTLFLLTLSVMNIIF